MNNLYHYYDIVAVNYTTTIHYDIATIPTTSPLRIPRLLRIPITATSPQSHYSAHPTPHPHYCNVATISLRTSPLRIPITTISLRRHHLITPHTPAPHPHSASLLGIPITATSPQSHY